MWKASRIWNLWGLHRTKLDEPDKDEIFIVDDNLEDSYDEVEFGA
jgi:hypothetical protein